MITVALIVAFALFVAAAVALALRSERRHRPLPHRPAHGTPPPPGPRHRIEHAHTASYSAAEVLRRLNAGQRS